MVGPQPTLVAAGDIGARMSEPTKQSPRRSLRGGCRRPAEAVAVLERITREHWEHYLWVAASNAALNEEAASVEAAQRAIFLRPQPHRQSTRQRNSDQSERGAGLEVGDVRFIPKAAELLRGSEMSRWATSWHVRATRRSGSLPNF